MGEPDRHKFDVAIRLGDHIGKIREKYSELMGSTDPAEQELGLAVYFIDTFLFRAGGSESKDTVGCCSLRLEHFELDPAATNIIKFDFLSKGGEPYRNKEKIDTRAAELLQLKKNNPNSSDKLFNITNPDKINLWLKQFDGDFTIKVFRTFWATRMMEDHLKKTKDDDDTEKKLQIFKESCLEVAKLCNHLKKNEKLENKISKNEKIIKKPPAHPLFQKYVERDNRRLQAENKALKSEAEQKIISAKTTIAYYIDPRIVVRWCKDHDIDIDLVYSEKLQEDFRWAIIGDPDSSQSGSSGQTSQGTGTIKTHTDSSTDSDQQWGHRGDADFF